MLLSGRRDARRKRRRGKRKRAYAHLRSIIDAPRSCTTRPQTTTAFFAARRRRKTTRIHERFERVVKGCWGKASSSSSSIFFVRCFRLSFSSRVCMYFYASKYTSSVLGVFFSFSEVVVPSSSSGESLSNNVEKKFRTTCQPLLLDGRTSVVSSRGVARVASAASFCCFSVLFSAEPSATQLRLNSEVGERERTGRSCEDETNSVVVDTRRNLSATSCIFSIRSAFMRSQIVEIAVSYTIGM